jgi:tetratricopeptide (TPR) repeat protein
LIVHPYRRTAGARASAALVALALLVWCSGSCRSQQLDDPVSDQRIRAGIELVYNLSFDSASTEFRAVVAAHPDHPAGHFFLAMVDWWRIVSDVGNAAYDERFHDQLDKVIALCESRLEVNESDLTALFYKGGALGFQGRLHGNRGDWIKAASAGRSALPIVQETYRLAPSNDDVLFGIGIYNYYAEVIPDHFPFVKPFMIFFPKGDRVKGMAQLRTASERARYANTEATYFLLQLLFNFEKQYADALPLALRLHARYPNNVLFHRYVGRVYAALADWGHTAQAFGEIAESVRSKKPGYDAAVEREARYYLGLRGMMELRYDEALASLYRCDELSRGLDKEEFSGFMVLANLRIGMIYDLQGKRDLALAQYKKVLDMKDFQQAHEQAEKYRKAPYQRS